MSETRTVVVIRESVAESWLIDSGTVVALVVPVLIGWWLESEALQWIGSIIAFLAICGRALGKTKPMTIAQAREYLDRVEAQEPSP